MFLYLSLNYIFRKEIILISTCRLSNILLFRQLYTRPWTIQVSRITRHHLYSIVISIYLYHIYVHVHAFSRDNWRYDQERDMVGKVIEQVYQNSCLAMCDGSMRIVWNAFASDMETETWCGEHVDFSAITFILQGPMGGLHVSIVEQSFSSQKGWKGVLCTWKYFKMKCLES